MIDRHRTILMGMLRVGELTLLANRNAPDDHGLVVVRDIDIYVRAERDHDDMTAEIERIRALILEKDEYARRLDAKLLNSEFLRNAPERVVRIEQDKRKETREQIEKLTEKLKKLGG